MLVRSASGLNGVQLCEHALQVIVDTADSFRVRPVDAEANGVVVAVGRPGNALFQEGTFTH